MELDEVNAKLVEKVQATGLATHPVGFSAPLAPGRPDPLTEVPEA